MLENMDCTVTSCEVSSGRDPIRFATRVLRMQFRDYSEEKTTATIAVAIRVGANGLEPSTSRM
jgi:hypothetical protein